MLSAPGAAMLNRKLFVSRLDGPFPDLYERFWDGDEWLWVNHGRPQGTKVTGIPGAAMLNEKLFVVVSAGALWERRWKADSSKWVWEAHGRPGDRSITGGPGAEMMNRKFFVTTDDGHLWERDWRADAGQWAWQDHGTPPGTKVATAPGAVMAPAKFFVGAENGHLFERLWDGTRWGWTDHGTACHDRAEHVIGTPGPAPKLSIAIIGDGFAERDLDTYAELVRDLVVSALSNDGLTTHHASLRVVRVDALSAQSGVRERRYNDAGKIISDNRRGSRLGVIPNDQWLRCWFDYSSYTDSRIEKLRRRFAADADHVVVLVNSETWGGCSTRGPGTAYFTLAGGWVVVAHEFGHNLFELDDEYVSEGQHETFAGTSTAANTTEKLANWTTLKWRALVAAGTPLPTNAAHLPAGWNRRTSVGAFEGAGGRYSRGLFRPVLECRMNQNDPPWCPVCRRKIGDDLAVFA
jgi:IgA Peptidase M64